MRRHEHRYWTGTVWTAHVADGGLRSDDPAVAAARRKLVRQHAAVVGGIVAFSTMIFFLVRDSPDEYPQPPIVMAAGFAAFWLAIYAFTEGRRKPSVPGPPPPGELMAPVTAPAADPVVTADGRFVMPAAPPHSTARPRAGAPPPSTPPHPPTAPTPPPQQPAGTGRLGGPGTAVAVVLAGMPDGELIPFFGLYRANDRVRFVGDEQIFAVFLPDAAAAMADDPLDSRGIFSSTGRLRSLRTPCLADSTSWDDVIAELVTDEWKPDREVTLPAQDRALRIEGALAGMPFRNLRLWLSSDPDGTVADAFLTMVINAAMAGSGRHYVKFRDQ